MPAWAIILTVYLLLGCVTVVLTLAAFPRYRGYRPPATTFLCAVSVLLICWPVAAMLSFLAMRHRLRVKRAGRQIMPPTSRLYRYGGRRRTRKL